MSKARHCGSYQRSFMKEKFYVLNKSSENVLTLRHLMADSRSTNAITAPLLTAIVDELLRHHAKVHITSVKDTVQP